MSSRKRRSSSRLKQEDDSQVVEVDLAEEAPEEQPRVKRERKSSGRSSTPASTAAAAAAAAAGGDAEDGDTPAGGGGARANGAPPRDRQQRTQFNEAEAASMMDKIKQLEDEGELAQDKAASLDLTAALDTAVSRVVRFLLFKHHEKPGVPVKRQEISDVITSSVGKGNKALKKLPALVFALAAAKLAKAFGLELRELRRHTPGSGNPAAAAAAAGSSAAAAAAGGGAAAAAAAAAAGTQSYKLLSMLPVDLLARYNLVESDNQERGFITMVLALLQMKQYKMDEDELWRHLGQVGLERDDQDAAMPFGKHPTKILEAMEHSRYLVKSRQAAPNTERGVVTQYEWGEAAHSEFGDNVLEGVVTQFLAGDQAVGS